MANEQFHEVKGKISFGGKVVRFLFWAYQAIMALWLFSYWNEIGQMHTHSAAESAGATVGSMLGTGLLVFFWIGGTIILGIPMLLTRAQKYLVKTDAGGTPTIAA